MTRKAYIEQIRRIIYNGQPPAEATVTIGLVNVWLNQAVALAAQKNYNDSIQLDGIEYVNNSFYITYKNLAITKDELFLYKISLPHIPLGIGDNLGLNTVILTDGAQNTYPVILINENQKSYSRGMRPIQNKTIGYSEGQFIFIQSVVPMTSLTAKVTMISAGDSTNLDSTLNVPDNYFPTMTDYLVKNLMFERSVALDVANDGQDFLTKTT